MKWELSKNRKSWEPFALADGAELFRMKTPLFIVPTVERRLKSKKTKARGF